MGPFPGGTDQLARGCRGRRRVRAASLPGAGPAGHRPGASLRPRPVAPRDAQLGVQGREAKAHARRRGAGSGSRWKSVGGVRAAPDRTAAPLLGCPSVLSQLSLRGSPLPPSQLGGRCCSYLRENWPQGLSVTNCDLIQAEERRNCGRGSPPSESPLQVTRCLGELAQHRWLAQGPPLSRWGASCHTHRKLFDCLYVYVFTFMLNKVLLSCNQPTLFCQKKTNLLGLITFVYGWQ